MHYLHAKATVANLCKSGKASGNNLIMVDNETGKVLIIPVFKSGYIFRVVDGKVTSVGEAPHSNLLDALFNHLDTGRKHTAALNKMKNATIASDAESIISEFEKAVPESLTMEYSKVILEMDLTESELAKAYHSLADVKIRPENWTYILKWLQERSPGFQTGTKYQKRSAFVHAVRRMGDMEAKNIVVLPKDTGKYDLDFWEKRLNEKQ